MRPTLFTNATPQLRIAQEQVFGPFLTAIRFKDEDDAQRIANDVAYGLTGHVWTNDLTRALRVSDRLEAGMICVNSENVRHLPTPFGGVKNSGIGRNGGDCICLRALEKRGHHCMILRQADAGSVGVLGFKVWSEADLDLAAHWFAGRGLPVAWVERPFMGRVLATRDPWGVPLEFHAAMDRLAPIHQQYSLYHGVKPLRIDHFNLFSANVDAAVAFYGDMGFRLTEYTADAGTGRIWAAWMHRKGGVHDMALTNGTGPRLHHTAFWVATPLNIIDLLDLMATSGYLANIERGPGRHGISNAFFLYICDQDGHRTEIYCSD